MTKKIEVLKFSPDELAGLLQTAFSYGSTYGHGNYSAKIKFEKLKKFILENHKPKSTVK